jgi:D-lyxose ketol-isomerase
MKRSRINRACRDAATAFARHGWTLPPDPCWDVTDCGLGRFDEVGLVLVNLAEEAEYCEKLMYSRDRQVTPIHAHRVKKEDIICRSGAMEAVVWGDRPEHCPAGATVVLKRNGVPFTATAGVPFRLSAGERFTLEPGVYHSFWAVDGDAIVGEVSTANDDATDNLFVDPAIGRYPQVEEDEAPAFVLLRDRP